MRRSLRMRPIEVRNVQTLMQKALTRDAKLLQGLFECRADKGDAARDLFGSICSLLSKVPYEQPF